jgi:hypothetical protein
MTQHGILATGEHRRYPSSLTIQHGVSYREHPGMKPVEAPRPHPSPNRLPSQSEFFELPSRHHPMLPPRDLGNLSISSARPF